MSENSQQGGGHSRGPATPAQPPRVAEPIAGQANSQIGTNSAMQIEDAAAKGAKRKGKGTAKGTEKPAIKSPKEKAASPQQQFWRDVGTTKSQIDASVSAAQTLVRAVDTDIAWKWVARLDEFDTLKNEHNKLEQEALLFPFWQDLRLKSTQEVRKRWSEVDVRAEVDARSGGRKASSQILDQCVHSIQSMVSARQAAAKANAKARPAKKVVLTFNE